MQIASGPKRSKLWVVGWVLIAANFVAQAGVSRVQEMLPPESTTRLALGVGTDFLTVMCFAGLACVIIGGLRNRNWQKEWERSRTPPSDPRP